MAGSAKERAACLAELRSGTGDQLDQCGLVSNKIHLRQELAFPDLFYAKVQIKTA
jgi:hypothetical protein